jgi:aldehyde dehydrogenase (NAD+)
MYYIAENLEIRKQEFAERLALLSGNSKEESQKEVDKSIQRLFHWAAFCDKYGGTVQETQLYGTVIKINEPVGVIGVVCPQNEVNCFKSIFCFLF